jgi:hypothetical protein
MPRMNGNEPKIEIFAPFGAAYELMKTILFRPFDIGKWLVIAFAAFLSGGWGGGFNPGRLGRFGGGDWKYRATSHGNWPSDWAMPAWGIALIIVGALALLVLIVVLMWVTSRGRFIFTDCVVKNRAAIAEPWREFRREGNSFFLFSLAVAFVTMLVTVVLVLIVAVPLGLFSSNRAAAAGVGASAVVLFILFGLVLFVFLLFFALVSHFMVPVMYRRRCSAKDAFLDVSKLVFRYPGPFILLVLFGIVLAIAVGIIGTLIACLTCCIGGLPYISTVLLLPAIVWLLAFKLLFIRQFGDQYDVWATVGFPAPSEVPPPSPPLPPPPIAPA